MIEALLYEGNSSALGLTANTTVVTSPPGQRVPPHRVGRMICTGQNTGQAYLLDGTSTTPTAANTIWTTGTATQTVGTVTTLNFPAQVGITIIPGGGTFSLSWD